MTEGLSIEQLADLKIVIERERKNLEEIEAKAKTAEAEYSRNFDEAARLKGEVAELVKQKEQLVADNANLIEEKGSIQSRFEEESAKKYADLRALETSVAASEQTVQLRLIEVDKRERDVAGKALDLEKKVVESKRAKEEASIVLLEIEGKKREITEERERLVEASKAYDEKAEASRVAAENAEAARDDVNQKLSEIEAKAAALSAATAENIAAEARAKSEKEEARRLIAVIDEAKAFIIEKTRKNGAKVEFSDVERLLARETSEKPHGEAKESDENLTVQENVVKPKSKSKTEPKSEEIPSSEPKTDAPSMEDIVKAGGSPAAEAANMGEFEEAPENSPEGTDPETPVTGDVLPELGTDALEAPASDVVPTETEPSL